MKFRKRRRDEKIQESAGGRKQKMGSPPSILKLFRLLSSIFYQIAV